MLAIDMGTVKNVGTGLAVAALDGAAASRDHTAGRSWQTPGVTLGGTPIVSWGWAPAVQIGAIGLGAGLLATGHESGRGPLLMGSGLMVRALTLTLAQHNHATPAKVQGLARPRAHGYTTPANGTSREIVRGPIGGQTRVTIAG